MKKYQSIICLVAAVCLLGTAAFSIYHIYDHYEQLDEQTEVFDEIAEVVAQAPDIVKLIPFRWKITERFMVMVEFMDWKIEPEPTNAVFFFSRIISIA